MRKPYLTSEETLEFIRNEFDTFMTYEALKKHLQRGNLKAKQFRKGCNYLITRGAVIDFMKHFNATRR